MGGREDLLLHEWILLCVPALLAQAQKHTHKPIPKEALLTRPPTVDLYMQPPPVNKSEEAA